MGKNGKKPNSSSGLTLEEMNLMQVLKKSM